MRLILVGVMLLLCGCASQIMQSYVGKPLSDAVSDYGTPVYSFDTGAGARTFLWSKNSSFVIPGSSTTTANVSTFGNTAQLYGTTTYHPPVSVSQQCTYAVYAKRTREDIEGPAAWTITGFKPPRLECE
ncbi:hypothetical protein NKH14_07075 [Mesorhizobium sp. M1380]|uniref:hypothetical protein n=1 Tax=Mesorhizobium sp. M1380 TaxID=2957093 RepID=UPI00333A8200